MISSYGPIGSRVLRDGYSLRTMSEPQNHRLGQNKQLTLAFQKYTQENNDILPWPNWGSRFQGWLYTPTNGGPPEPSNPPQSVYAGGTLWPYLKNVKVYWCPADYTNTP